MRGPVSVIWRGHARCTGGSGSWASTLAAIWRSRAARNPDVLAAASFYATDIDTGTLGKGDHSLKRAGEIKGELTPGAGRTRMSRSTAAT